MPPKPEKTHPQWQLANGLVCLALLAACEQAPSEAPQVMPPAISVTPSCGRDGRLATELYGSIARQILWTEQELQCESMLRPAGKGVRLRFTGITANNRLAIILAFPELTRGDTATETPTVITLTVEGSGRFFSTPTSRSCWSDVVTQDLVEDGDERYDISGTLYCVAPLGEINGTAAITIPKLEFRGIIDWSAA